MSIGPIAAAKWPERLSSDGGVRSGTHPGGGRRTAASRCTIKGKPKPRPASANRMAKTTRPTNAARDGRRPWEEPPAARQADVSQNPPRSADPSRQSGNLLDLDG